MTFFFNNNEFTCGCLKTKKKERIISYYEHKQNRGMITVNIFKKCINIEREKVMQYIIVYKKYLPYFRFFFPFSNKATILKSTPNPEKCYSFY